jgi:hypothetical protein
MALRAKQAVAMGGAGLLALGVGAWAFRNARHPHGVAAVSASELSLLATGDVWGEVEPCG